MLHDLKDPGHLKQRLVDSGQIAQNELSVQLLQLLVACQHKADAGAVHKCDLLKIELYRLGLIFIYQVDADLFEIANGKIIQIPVKIKVKDTVNILMFHVHPSADHSTTFSNSFGDIRQSIHRFDRNFLYYPF